MWLNILFCWFESDFRNAKVNEVMVGLKKAEAGSEMIVIKENKKSAVSKEKFEEEWGGISANV